jgi:hypothetical protein
MKQQTPSGTKSRAKMPQREGMTMIASGEIGDQVDWEPGFEALGEVQWILSHFEDLGDEESIDWGAIIGGHHYFDGIRSYFPPLYNQSDFEDVFREFLAIIREPSQREAGYELQSIVLISRDRQTRNGSSGVHPVSRAPQRTKGAAGRRNCLGGQSTGQSISDKWSDILVPTDPFEGFDRFRNIGLASRVKVLSINSQRPWFPKRLLAMAE